MGRAGGGLGTAWPLLLALALSALVLVITLHDSAANRTRNSIVAKRFDTQRRQEDISSFFPTLSDPFNNTTNASPTQKKLESKRNVTEKEDVLNYGIIVDAGSSGSRGFVYVWPPHSGDPHQLLRIEPLTDDLGYPVFKKIAPGLSSMADNPQNATEYMRPLLDYLSTKIPKAKHKETSLFILATAGLRLIPEEPREAILANLRRELPKFYEFIVMEQHIQMISGKWEGIYSWIAVNYALDRLNSRPNSSFTVGETKPGTVGMIDMGGGSVQIAFELASPLPSHLTHLGHTINLGCMDLKDHDEEHTYRLYVTTFLGFGANSAQTRYEESLYNDFRSSLPKARQRREAAGSNETESELVVQSMAVVPAPPGSSFHEQKQLPGPRRRISVSTTLPPNTVRDPCLANGMTQELGAPSSEAGEEGTPITRLGTGDFPLCLERLKNLLNKGAPCEEDPCSMDGRHQPLIDFGQMPFYGFSEYWFSYNDVLSLGTKWDLDALVRRHTEFCGARWNLTFDRFERKLYPKADLDRIRTQCFKGAWIATVLHEGFGFPRQQPLFHSVQLLRGQEVQWTLGALLYKLRYFPLREVQRLREEAALEHRHAAQSGFLPASPGAKLAMMVALVIGGWAAARLVCLLHRQEALGLRSEGLRRTASVWAGVFRRSPSASLPRRGGISPRRTHSEAHLLTSVYAKKDYIY